MCLRLLLLLLLSSLVGCQCGSGDAAVRLTVTSSGFRPGCIRVEARDARGAGAVRTQEVAGKGEPTGGAVTVAVFQEPGWGPILTLKAEAFERTCTQTQVATASGEVEVATGQIATLTLALSSRDEDRDGYVAHDAGGTDCDDTRSEAHPDAAERCNARDDNCDGVRDEGLALGSVCATSEGCTGAWVCNAQEERACVSQPHQWRPDRDGDGKGDAQSQGFTSCQQPDGGYVPNALDCDDANARRYQGAPELCDAFDDDCDGVVNNGLEVGGNCQGGSGCAGTRACAADGGVFCDSPAPRSTYVDQDLDGQGAADAGAVSSCGLVPPGYSLTPTDCDDTRAQTYTGAPEVCDAQDNDCDQQVDESFNLDAGCAPGGQNCSGVVVCAADGGTECLRTSPPPVIYYPDDDLDQHGQEDGGVAFCGTPGAGYRAESGDCNDGNPFTHQDARELCDLEDNDCDGQPEAAGLCPDGGPAWVATSHGDTGKSWRSVALWGDGGVLAVGESSRRARKRPDERSFTVLTDNCSADWLCVWVDPSTGMAYLGGVSDKLGIQAPDSAACTVDPPKVQDTSTSGVWGYSTPADGLVLQGVGGKDAFNGRTFEWDGRAVTLNATASTSVAFADVHGLSPELLFAVGRWGDPANDPRLYRYEPLSKQWRSETVDPSLSGLNAVWVVHPALAYAVGDDRSILEWNGQTWRVHPPPPQAAPDEDFSGVVAFGRSSVYIASKSGHLYRYNGLGWTRSTPAPGTNFFDIAATSPEDLWVAGSAGRIVHWPD